MADTQEVEVALLQLTAEILEELGGSDFVRNQKESPDDRIELYGELFRQLYDAIASKPPEAPKGPPKTTVSSR